jgi:AcrR family transcriptional regulator
MNATPVFPSVPPLRDHAVDSKRQLLLDAAFQVFARLGYRKASMDEVARAAQVSRQGLYLHFATKEHLFRATVGHCFDTAIENVATALAAPQQSLEERLSHALDAWLGYTVEARGGGFDELIQTTRALLGPMIEERARDFHFRLEAAVAAAPELAPVCAGLGITPADLALTLTATAIGLKHICHSRDEFRAAAAKAVAVVCRPDVRA